MARRFTDLHAVSDLVKSKSDILLVILEDTGRKPHSTGTNNFIFCPLHDEKNKASFNINTQLQMYRCFGGCQDGGDVIKWVTVWHGMDYVSAIEYLAQRFNVDLSLYTRPLTREEEIKDRYQYIFSTVVEWCHTQLMHHDTLLRWYREDSGLNDDQIRLYKVGYCPSVDMLVNFLAQKVPGVTHDDIRKLELDRRAHLDDALVYPIHDLNGVPVRIYTKPNNPPPTASYKYLGTSNEHPLFKKDLIYGLYQRKKELRSNGFKVILCEGFKACMAAGGIAVMGTAISDEQLQLLRQVNVKTIIACFDGDHAGYLASLKVVEELNRFTGILIKIAKLPLDTQCDSLIKQHGKLALDAVLANAMLPVEFLISTKFDLTQTLTTEHKYGILNDVAPILAKMSDVEIDINISYIAQTIGAQDEAIKSYIRDLKAANSKLANSKAEEALLYHIIMGPSCWATVKTHLVDIEHFAFSEHQRIFAAITASYKLYKSQLTARVVQDQLGILYPINTDITVRRLETIAITVPEYSFDAAIAIVIDMWRRRTIIKQSGDLSKQMLDMKLPPTESLQLFRRTSISAVETAANRPSTPDAVAASIDALINERMASGSRIIGYDFNATLPILNVVLSGLQKQHQIIISANQGVGKSLLALNMIKPIVIDQRVPWLWVHQEMGAEELGLRFISVMSGINNTRLQSADLSPDEYLRYCLARDVIAASNLHFRRASSGTMDEIFAIVEEEKNKHGIEGIVLDYIQLICASRDQRGMSRTEVIGNASKVLCNRVAQDMNLVSLCIAQLNRDGFKTGEIREAENVGGAYEIAQDAHDFITISRKSEKQIEEGGRERGTRMIYVDKRRGGASDICIHADIDERDAVSLRFKECATLGEMIGFTKTQAA